MATQRWFRTEPVKWATRLIFVFGGLLVLATAVGYVWLLVDPDRSLAAADWLLGIVIILSLFEVSAVIFLAYRLWHLHSPAKNAADEVRAGLAIALGTGVAIALGVLVLQLAVQAISEQREVRAQRENIRFSIGLSADLTGFVAPRDPADPSRHLDMSGFWFRGKNMPLASFNDAPLRGANFVFTNLDGAHLRRIDLREHDGQRSDLRAAYLRWADLSGAQVGNASFVDADLTRAWLCGVDLSQANLTRTDLRGAKLDKTPGGDCEEPGRLPATKPEGACWPGDTPVEPDCGVEARLIQQRRD